MMKKLEIRFGEVKAAISVMREVAAWGRERGYRVWLDEWLTEEELITPDAPPECFCIGMLDGEIACAFILQWADHYYWPQAPEGEAAYIHKLCVRRKFAGMGMTGIITEAVRTECRKRGVRYIRLDTGGSETRVRSIYENTGYQLVDTHHYPNGRWAALYQLRVDKVP